MTNSKDVVLIREQRAFALDIKAMGDDGTVEGYGSVFGVEDSYSDIITRGAFGASMSSHKAAGTMPAMLWQHDADAPIGVWTQMGEDTHGLMVKGQLAMETQRGREIHSLLKIGAVTGLSIGYMPKAFSRDRESGIRTLSEIDLMEVSLVTFPANTRARVTSVKAADVAQIETVRQAEDTLRDAGFTVDGAKAFIASVKRMALAERDAREAEARIKRAAETLSHLLHRSV